MDPKLQPKPECQCSFRMLRGEETRIHNPRCPIHGKPRHLKLLK